MPERAQPAVMGCALLHPHADDGRSTIDTTQGHSVLSVPAIDEDVVIACRQWCGEPQRPVPASWTGSFKLDGEADFVRPRLEPTVRMTNLVRYPQRLSVPATSAGEHKAERIDTAGDHARRWFDGQDGEPFGSDPCGRRGGGFDPVCLTGDSASRPFHVQDALKSRIVLDAPIHVGS